MSDVIALICDADQTLNPELMQKPLFEHYGVTPKDFFAEVSKRVESIRKQGKRIQSELAYLNLILEKIADGTFKNLNDVLLRKIGKDIEFCKGVPAVFGKLRKLLAAEFPEIKLEVYVVSSGMKELLMGSALMTCPEEERINDVYACEFLEKNDVLSEVVLNVSYTEKTRFLFEISKGTAKVNERIPIKRVPFKQMIYVGDGLSDVPCFSLLMDNGGHCLGIYDPDNKESYEKVKKLLDDKRVHAIGPWDYTEKSPTYKWLVKRIRKIAKNNKIN